MGVLEYGRFATRHSQVTRPSQAHVWWCGQMASPWEPPRRARWLVSGVLRSSLTWWRLKLSSIGWMEIKDAWISLATVSNWQMMNLHRRSSQTAQTALLLPSHCACASDAHNLINSNRGEIQSMLFQLFLTIEKIMSILMANIVGSPLMQLEFTQQRRRLRLVNNSMHIKWVFMWWTKDSIRASAIF
jgi:hypothetical protein